MESFFSKKNIINLLLLGILILAVPLTVKLAREQKIFFSKATSNTVEIFGPGVTTRSDGKKVTTTRTVKVRLNSPSLTQASLPTKFINEVKAQTNCGDNQCYDQEGGKCVDTGTVSCGLDNVWVQSVTSNSDGTCSFGECKGNTCGNGQCYDQEGGRCVDTGIHVCGSNGTQMYSVKSDGNCSFGECTPYNAALDRCGTTEECYDSDGGRCVALGSISCGTNGSQSVTKTVDGRCIFGNCVEQSTTNGKGGVGGGGGQGGTSAGSCDPNDQSKWQSAGYSACVSPNPPKAAEIFSSPCDTTFVPRWKEEVDEPTCSNAEQTSCWINGGNVDAESAHAGCVRTYGQGSFCKSLVSAIGAGDHADGCSAATPTSPQPPAPQPPAPPAPSSGSCKEEGVKPDPNPDASKNSCNTSSKANGCACNNDGTCANANCRDNGNSQNTCGGCPLISSSRPAGGTGGKCDPSEVATDSFTQPDGFPCGGRTGLCQKGNCKQNQDGINTCGGIALVEECKGKTPTGGVGKCDPAEVTTDSFAQPDGFPCGGRTGLCQKGNCKQNQDGINTCGGVALADVCKGKTQPGGQFRATHFKLAESQAGLVDAREQVFTGDGQEITHEFADANPGEKFIFVQFIAKDSQGNVKARSNLPERDSVILLLPAPRIVNTNCEPTGSSSTKITLTGVGFGAIQGNTKVTVDGTTVSPTSWSNTKIVLETATAVENTKQVKVTDESNQEATGTCPVFGTSELELKVKGACLPADKTLPKVKVKVADNDGNKRFEDDNVSVGSDNKIKISPKLQNGKKHQMLVDAPGFLTRKIEFTSAAGSSTLNDLTLPWGDIFPEGGDEVVNSFDKSAMNSQWIIGQSASGRSADCNKDDRVNAVDWGFMRATMSQNPEGDKITAGKVAGVSTSSAKAKR